MDRARDAVINKRMASVFHDSLIPSLLVWHKVDTVILTGGSTSGCVRASAVSSLSHGYRTIAEHTGQRCAGYLAPALTHTERTLDLFSEAGGLYTCDLFHDDQPTPVKVRSGKPFVSVPYSLELNDTMSTW